MRLITRARNLDANFWLVNQKYQARQIARMSVNYAKGGSASPKTMPKLIGESRMFTNALRTTRSTIEQPV
jgi:hypothetical protein